MLRKSVLAAFAASVITLPAFAAGASKEENTGVSVGVVIGAIAGGPVGAIVGAAVGAGVGDKMHKRGEKIDSLSASLDGSRTHAAALENSVAALNGEIRSKDGELREMRESARPEVLAMLAAGIEMDLLFRTDEDALTISTSEKIAELAASLADNSDIQIRLDGYADERGDAAYNQELSLRRVEHVRDLLVTSGIPAARVTANAHGESQAIDASVDSYALERRVSLVLYLSDAPSFASNPR